MSKRPMVDLEQMGALPRDAYTPEADAAAAWRRARAGSGVTSGLILSYLERELGRGAVDELLALPDMSEREEELRDEDTWFSFEEKIKLWQAATAVTGDPLVAERVGERVLDFSVGMTLRRAMRALGTPDFAYRNVPRANAKFNWAHTMEVVERQPGQVRLAYRDVSGVGYHRFDCDYTIGLLRTIPQLFGLPAARVSHPLCGARGEDHCQFDVRWSGDVQRTSRKLVLAGVAGVAVLGAGAFVDPVMAVGGGAVMLLSGVAAVVRTMAFMRRRIGALENRVRDQDLAAESQLNSLATLSSDLRLDEVLERITASASSAIGGAQFALLIAEAGHMRADRHSGLSEGSLRALEAWAQGSQGLIARGPLVIDDLAGVPALRNVADSDELPLGSTCAVPLVFGERLLGVLIALTPGATAFLPHDVRALEIYAGHAAIALSNAHLVDQLGREAAEDPLTGLANKRALQLAGEAELSRSGREQTPFSLVVIDLDHFKDINDSYGHPFGDQVLVAVAKALRSAVRAHDVVGRMGGEEFVLLLPGTGGHVAHAVVERARKLIGDIEVPGGRLSSSAGVAATTAGQSSLDELFEAADRALYQAKRQGRGRTELTTLSS